MRGLTVLFLLLLTGCAGKSDVTVLRLAHSLDTGHPVHQAMVVLGDRLRELSGGSLRVDIYPGEQLGSERETLELLQIGSLAMTKSSASVMANFAPSYQVLGLPYLFRGEDHAWQVLEGRIGQELLTSSEPQRLRGLTFYDAGSRSFYTRDRPIHSPADLAGLKIRTQESAVAMTMVGALGGAATPVAWGELYTALQQGVVDGAENNPPSFHLSRHYEVARFYSLDEHTRVPDVLLVSTVVWKTLTAEQQGWLQAAADESARYQRQIWKQAENEALAAVAEAGVEIVRPDKTAFADRVEAMYEDYRDQPEIHDLIQRIQKVGLR